jgi:hypothetical protein
MEPLDSFLLSKKTPRYEWGKAVFMFTLAAVNFFGAYVIRIPWIRMAELFIGGLSLTIALTKLKPKYE